MGTIDYVRKVYYDKRRAVITLAALRKGDCLLGYQKLLFRFPKDPSSLSVSWPCGSPVANARILIDIPFPLVGTVGKEKHNSILPN